MTKRLLIVACAFMLGGCALPVPLQIASWAVDGLLLVATEKTMADHGVSMIAQRDCAMLRVVTEGAWCRDEDGVKAVAVLDLPPPGGAEEAVSVVDAGHVVDGLPAIGPDARAVTDLASFETAAGDFTDHSRNAPVDETSADEARWNAIIAAPSFLDDPTVPIDVQPKRQWPPEQAIDQPVMPTTVEREPELATDKPSGGEGLEFLSHGDDPLHLGDIFYDLRPFVMAELTLRGRANGDILHRSTGGIGDARDPEPATAPVAGTGGPYRFARRRRPSMRSMGLGGRRPPSRQGIGFRMARARGSGIGPPGSREMARGFRCARWGRCV
jgi:hypothetical protein